MEGSPNQFPLSRHHSPKLQKSPAPSHPQPSVKPTATAIATASRSQPSTAATTLTTATTTASCFSPSPPPLSSSPSVAELAYSLGRHRHRVLFPRRYSPPVILWNMRGNPEEHQEEELDLPYFDMATLIFATNNFSTNNILGKGSFGAVYKRVPKFQNELICRHRTGDDLLIPLPIIVKLLSLLVNAALELLHLEPQIHAFLRLDGSTGGGA
ncbi:G-type lectin S-receptor-like serine/threonine-protein kinase [Arachis hypogaea]|nr:G-type lectin S-receptor-like serine/threonine-protein kinase [Arachis hypogaea]